VSHAPILPDQPGLFGPDAAWPPGFVYRPELIGPDEETALAAGIAALPFAPFLFRGYEGRRRVVSFGQRYDFEDGALHEAAALPAFLEPTRAKAAALAGVEEGAFVHALVTEYAPGAPIGWHRDRPQFGTVVGLSLLAPCVFRLRRKVGSRWRRVSVPLAPRSGYVLAGEVRRDWEHSIPPLDALRYSVTFRTLAGHG
jgi:alkylated DNA repair dioxygenase AlkB